MVVIFALFFLIIVAVSVIGYKVYKEEYLKTSSKKDKEDGEKTLLNILWFLIALILILILLAAYLAIK